MSFSTGIAFENIDYVKKKLIAKGTLTFGSDYENEKKFVVKENERNGYSIESEEELTDKEQYLILLTLENKINYTDY